MNTWRRRRDIMLAVIVFELTVVINLTVMFIVRIL